MSGRHSFYANGTPNIVGAFDINGKASFPAGSPSGTYFMDGNTEVVGILSALLSQRSRVSEPPAL